MAVAGSYHGVHTVMYDATAITGVISVNWAPTVSQAVSLIAGDGVASHYTVGATAITGAFVFHSPVEAAKMADKVAITTDVTFKIIDEVGVDKTITIASIKTSGILGAQHSLQGAGPWAVQFVADSASAPA